MTEENDNTSTTRRTQAKTPRTDTRAAAEPAAARVKVIQRATKQQRPLGVKIRIIIGSGIHGTRGRRRRGERKGAIIRGRRGEIRRGNTRGAGIGPKTGGGAKIGGRRRRGSRSGQPIKRTIKVKKLT